MWPLRRSWPFLEPELEAWHLTAWTWLLANVGGVAAIRTAPLVLPTRAFFPSTEATGHDAVLHVFAHVKRHAEVADWPCDLVAQPEQPEMRVSEFVVLRRAINDPAGTFGLEGNRPAITYDPNLAADAMKLVAVLAHELAHLRLMIFEAPLPGGRDANERATDLATVAMGFAVFGANCSFSFERYQDPISQGWRTSRLGYLDEREWAFAIAVFLILTRRSADAVRRFMKPHLAADVAAATASLLRRDLLGGLQTC